MFPALRLLYSLDTKRVFNTNNINDNEHDEIQISGGVVADIHRSDSGGKLLFL